MRFLKSFLFNLVFLIAIFVALYLIFPDLMRGVFEVYGALFGPGLVILLLIVAALPRNRRRH